LSNRWAIHGIINPEATTPPTEAIVDETPPPAGSGSEDMPITFNLPSVKGIHRNLYQGLINERRLAHDPKKPKRTSAQLTKWDNQLRPGGKTGMYRDVYEFAESELGLPRRSILRPRWSRDNDAIEMEVDHIVELRFTPASEKAIWDEIGNYELLDKSSNASSGAQLLNSIADHRERLAKETGDTSWLDNRILVFNRLEIGGGPRGERWLADEIQRGDHIIVYLKHRGERRPRIR
jgi:hypothetical protein